MSGVIEISGIDVLLAVIIILVLQITIICMFAHWIGIVKELFQSRNKE